MNSEVSLQLMGRQCCVKQRLQWTGGGGEGWCCGSATVVLDPTEARPLLSPEHAPLSPACLSWRSILPGDPVHCFRRAVLGLHYPEQVYLLSHAYILSPPPCFHLSVCHPPWNFAHPTQHYVWAPKSIVAIKSLSWGGVVPSGAIWQSPLHIRIMFFQGQFLLSITEPFRAGRGLII